MPTNYNPLASAAPQPGFVPASSTYGQGVTHPEWVKTTAEYLASSWANGWRGLPGGWDPARYGTPDPNDTNGVWSPRTILAFSQYAAQYTPGSSEYIDNNIPYVAPSATDYIEDPVTTANRIAAENADKTLEYSYAKLAADSAYQQGQLALGQGQLNLGYAELGLGYAQLDEQIKDNMRRALLQQFSTEVDRYAVEANLYNAAELNKIHIYETDAAIYTTLEGLKQDNLRAAGQLSLGQQELYDARTREAMSLRVNPQDFVQREYAARGLQSPTATDVPAYKNVDSLSEVIKKLIEYSPDNPRPVAPTPGTPPTAPSAPNLAQLAWANAPTTNPLVPAGPIPQQVPQAPAPHTGPYYAAGTDAGTSNSQPYYTVTFEDVAPGTPAYAKGGETIAKTFIAGDPRFGNQANPELIQITGKDVKTKVTPIKLSIKGGTPAPNGAIMKGKGRKVKAFANGTGSDPSTVTIPSYDDTAYQNLPSLKYLQGGLARAAYNTLDTKGAAGAFGTHAPGAGSINYGKWLDIAQDPDAVGALSSIFQSANRNLLTDVARAKARAPFGQAVQTSLVRT